MFPAMSIIMTIWAKGTLYSPAVKAFEYIGATQWPERMRMTFMCPESGTITWAKLIIFVPC